MKKIFKGTAIFHIKPERTEDFKKEVLQIITPTRQEKGNISYEAYQVMDETGQPTSKFEFHELWVNKDSMMTDHKENTPHMQKFFKTIRLGEKDTWIEKVEISGSDVLVL